MPRNVLQLRSNLGNAGLARMAGGAGYGFSNAGKQIANLGSSYDKQERDDAAITAANNLRNANSSAAQKTKEANQNAMRAKNYAFNPEIVAKIKAQYGVSDNLANAIIGLIDLGTPTVRKGFSLSEGQSRYDGDGKPIASLAKVFKPKVKYVKPSGDGGNDIIIYDDGTSEVAKFKTKSDWNKGNGGSSKDKVPAGYKYAGEYNISDDLEYELALSGSYFTDKNGKRFVNIEKYNRLKKLGDTEVN